jgi:hypothetical protein
MVPSWLAISVTAFVAIPGLVILLSGISVLVKRNIIRANYGLVLLGLWILSLGVSAFQVPKILKNFSSEVSYQEIETISPSGKVLVLKGSDLLDNPVIFENVTLQLKGVPQETISLIMNYQSRGKNKEEAMANAKAIQYNYSVQDSTVIFPNFWTMDSMKQFRAQELELILQIPYEQAFIMDESLKNVIRNTVYKNGYKIRDLTENNYFVFNERGLLCLTCKYTGNLTAVDSASVLKFMKKHPTVTVGQE